MTPFSPLLYLLDDDPDFTALLNVVLSRLGMRTETFTKSEELIARIKAHRPHMAIIDLQLEGGQSGLSNSTDRGTQTGALSDSCRIR
jgi:ActR/RegA family two-component response regulator